jgi:hypothetical protein
MRLGTAPRLESWLAGCNERPHLWLLICAALLAVQISPWWYPAPDSVLYLSIARSIVKGEHISRLGSSQLAFPPGYPLLISPAFLVGDRPFLLLSVIHWGMAVALMLGVYVWARRQCPAAALLITGLVMVNIGVWVHYRRMLSELAFMMVAVWTVYVLNAARRASTLRSALSWGVAGALLLVLLGMIREVGVLFGAGCGAALCIDAYRHRQRWSRAIILALLVSVPAAVAVAGFTRYDVAMAQRSVEHTGTHWDGLVRPQPTGRVAEGVRLRISDIGRLTIPGMFKAYSGPGQWVNVNLAVYVAVCVLVTFGWWKFISRECDVYALTLPFYLAAYVAWPFDGGTRYVVPLLPVLLACVWFAIESRRRWRLTLLAALLVAHLAVAVGYWTLIEIPRARECNAEWSSAEELAARLRGSSQTLLAANVPPCLWLMLAFSLDRPVDVSSDGVAVDREVQWIVMPDGDPTSPGFRAVATIAKYKLLTRDDDR